jgi:hypothetical protein
MKYAVVAIIAIVVVMLVLHAKETFKDWES